MKAWLNKNFYVVSLLLSFIAFCIFKEYFVFFVLTSVILFFLYSKCIYGLSFYYYELTLFLIYLVFATITIVFLKKDTLYLMTAILGVWLICSFFKNDRFHN